MGCGCGLGVLAVWEILRSPLKTVVSALDAALGLDWLHGGEEEGSAHSVGGLLLCRWCHKERLVLKGGLMA